MMKLRFGRATTRMTEKYNGKDDLRVHLEKWTKAWGTKTTARMSTHILSYYGYNSHELVFRNGAPLWHCGMGLIEGRFLIDF